MIALERARNEENRLHDETNRNASRIQPSGYGSGRMPSYFVQTESQLVTEEISGKINNSGFFFSLIVLFCLRYLFLMVLLFLLQGKVYFM